MWLLRCSGDWTWLCVGPQSHAPCSAAWCDGQDDNVDPGLATEPWASQRSRIGAWSLSASGQDSILLMRRAWEGRSHSESHFGHSLSPCTYLLAQLEICPFLPSSTPGQRCRSVGTAYSHNTGNTGGVTASDTSILSGKPRERMWENFYV